MAFDAGAIEATMTLDRTPFNTGLRQARKDGLEFAKRKFVATVDLDTKRAQVKLAALEREIAALDSTAEVVINETVHRTVHETGGGGTGGTGGTGGGGGGGGRGGSNVSRSNAAAGGGLLLDSILAFAPGAAPLIAEATAAVGALGSSFVAAGAAAAGFGALAMPLFSKVGDSIKQMDTLQKQYNKASTDKQRLQILKQEKQLWDDLTPTERKAYTELTGIRQEWRLLTASLESPIFNALQPWLATAETGMRMIPQLAAPATVAIGLLGDEVHTALNTAYWQRFFNQLANVGGQALFTFGDSAINVAHGLAGIFTAFLPLTEEMLPGVDNLSERFAHFGATLWQRQGFLTFLSYVEDNGPVVVHLLTSVGSTLVHVTGALGPLGSLTLRMVTATAEFVDWLSREHPLLVQVAVGALEAKGALGLLARANTALGLGSAVSGLTGFVGGLRGVEREAGAAGATTNRLGRAIRDFGPTITQFGSGLRNSSTAMETGATRATKLGAAVKNPRVGMNLLAGAVGASTLALTGWGIGLGAAVAGLLILNHYLPDVGTWYANNALEITRNTVTQANNVAQLQAANRALAAQRNNLRGAGQSMNNFGVVMNGSGQAWKDYTNQIRANNGQIQAIRSNSQAMANVYNAAVQPSMRITAQDAIQLANRLGINLGQLKGNSKEAQNARNKFREYAAQMQLSQNPTRAISHDFWVLGQRTADETTKLNALRDALDRAIGRFVSADRSLVTWRTDMTQATRTLRQNSYTTDLNTAAGRRNRTQIDQTTQDVIDYATAQYRSTGRLGDSTKAIKDQIRWLKDQRQKAKDAGRDTTYYSNTIRELKKWLDKVNKTTAHPKVKVDASGKYNYFGGPGASNHVNWGKVSGHFAAGGPVDGPGTPTSDDVPAWLSRDEHVWTAREVAGAGGHVAVERLRKLAGMRQLPGLAVGGTVDHPGLTHQNTPYRFADGGNLPYKAGPVPGFGGTAVPAAGSRSEDVANSIEQQAIRNTAYMIWKEMQGGGSKAVDYAVKQLGKPYVWGAAGPNAFDCSGLTWRSWLAAGKNITRTTWTQVHQGTRATRATAMPGDLWFPFNPHHVMMFTGGKGGREMIHAPHTGDVVRYAPYRGAGIIRHIAGGRYGAGASGAGVPGSNAKAFALNMLRNEGLAWTYSDLVKLWQHESSWNPWAVNRSSGAYGIPQALGHGHPYALGDWRAQVIWGLNYISGRYGNPSRAWRFWQGHHWYDDGGDMAPGGGMYFNGTNRTESVVTAPWRDQVEQALAEISAQVSARPSLVGGDLVLQSSGNVHDDMEEAMFALRRMEMGATGRGR